MAEEIQLGMVLLRNGARLPRLLQLESEPFVKNWKLLKNLDGRRLGRRVRDAGWEFVHLTGEVETSAVGLNEQRTILRALRKVFSRNESSKFSCQEITRLVVNRSLGLVLVRVAVRPRVIQEELSRPQGRNISNWYREKLIGG